MTMSLFVRRSATYFSAKQTLRYAQMPQGEGGEVLRIIFTRYPAFETALEALRQHVNDYLIKGTPIIG